MLSVLIPVYNEADILVASSEKVHRYLLERSIDHELLVTSNGSTDSTVAIGRDFAAKNDWFRFFELPTRSVGGAFALGVNEARYEFLVSLDVDLSFDLRFLDYAKDLLAYADMVVGSKTMGKQRRSVLRVIASQTYILFSQLLFNLTVSDYSIGCKAYRRQSVLPLLPGLDAWTGYVLELCIALDRSGKRIIQIGVDCDDHRPSRFNLIHEGFYRFRHLWHCRTTSHRDASLLANVQDAPPVT